MIAYIVNNTWVKIKILPLNWEVWNTIQEFPCQKFVKETKIQAGIQLELFWVEYADLMIVGQFISMRNNTVARMKKIHFGKGAHINYIYCITNIFILVDMALFSISCCLFTF